MEGKLINMPFLANDFFPQLLVTVYCPAQFYLQPLWAVGNNALQENTKDGRPAVIDVIF